MVPASTSLSMASFGAIRDRAAAAFIFQAGTTAFSFSAGLETTNRLTPVIFPERAVLSITTPPNEWPTGTTSPRTAPCT